MKTNVHTEKTRKGYEHYLNEHYAIPGNDSVPRTILSLRVKKSVLELATKNGQLGSLIKKYAPNTFTNGFSEWKP